MSDSWDVERDEVIIFNGSFFKKKACDIWVSPKVKASHPIKNSEGKPQQLLEVVTKKVPSWKTNLRVARRWWSLWWRSTSGAPWGPMVASKCYWMLQCFRVIRKATVARWTNGWAFIERNLFWDALKNQKPALDEGETWETLVLPPKIAKLTTLAS